MRIIIEGAGEVGSHLAKMLSLESNEITVIDPNNERLSKLTEVADVATVCGAKSSIKSLKKANIANSDLFIAVNPHTPQDINIVSALLAKSLGCKKVTARIDNEDFLSSENKVIFKDMGLDFLFHPEKIAADEIIELLTHTESSENIDFARGKLKVSVFKLDEDSPILDMKLAEFTALAADGDQQFRVIALARNGETIIPRPDIKFQFNDLIYVISKRQAIDNIMKLIGKATIEINKVMILGASPIAKIVSCQLIDKVDSIKIIDIDREKCLQLSENIDNENINIINGDGRDSDFLLEEGVKDYDAVIALGDNDETNILSCIMAKKLGVSRVIAEVENLEYIRLAEDLGVDAIINKKLITAGRIFRLTLSGKAKMVKYMNGTNAEIIEYTVAPNAIITKKPLREIDFPKNAILGGVIRGSESFIAVGDTQIEAYDRVAVFAMSESIKEIDKYFK